MQPIKSSLILFSILRYIAKVRQIEERHHYTSDKTMSGQGMLPIDMVEDTDTLILNVIIDRFWQVKFFHN